MARHAEGRTHPRLSWIVGGAQGSGVDTAATTFGRAAAHAGLEGLGKREVYSNIKGRHSYYHVMVSPRKVLSHEEHADIVVGLDAESTLRHVRELVPGGAIVYNPAHAAVDPHEVPTLEHRVADEIAEHCKAHGESSTLEGLIKAEAKRGVKPVPIPFTDLLTKIAPKVGATYGAQIERVANTMAVGVSLALVGLEEEVLVAGLKDVFGKRQKLYDMNALGATEGFKAALPHAPTFAVKLAPQKPAGPRLFLTGNQAVALGKIAGGCRFQTYYPITPASDESEFLEARGEITLKDGSKTPMVVVQTEDEIAAITMASGAALTGARAATSTSGPGFSLMMEGLGWAAINEVPVVVSLYMRSGPSTGMPTRSEQGDLMFALHAGHGEFPRFVLASGDLEELIADAAWAHDLADLYQTPVIHLIDKALAVSSGTIPTPDLDSIAIHRGALIDAPDPTTAAYPFPRFKVTESGVSPRPVFGLEGHIFYVTGDESDEIGHITEDPVTRDTMVEKRRRKLQTADREIPESLKTSHFGREDADLLLISWGSTKGAVLHALLDLEAAGHKVGFLQVRLLNPFPGQAVASAVGRAKRFAVVEANESGQLADLIAMRTGLLAHHRLVKTNGRPVVPAEVVSLSEKVLEGTARPRELMTLGS
jgi:2-oxoglutarate ferredoxin oxidoreductase subunit alpha